MQRSQHKQQYGLHPGSPWWHPGSFVLGLLFGILALVSALGVLARRDRPDWYAIGVSRAAGGAVGLALLALWPLAFWLAGNVQTANTRAMVPERATVSGMKRGEDTSPAIIPFDTPGASLRLTNHPDDPSLPNEVTDLRTGGTGRDRFVTGVFTNGDSRQHSSCTVTFILRYLPGSPAGSDTLDVTVNNPPPGVPVPFRFAVPDPNVTSIELLGVGYN